MVRVLIERHVSEGMVENFRLALHEVRASASRGPGYISGESLRDAQDDHRYVVISTWQSRDDWAVWERSEARRALLVRLMPMLDEPEQITVLEPV